MMVEMSNKPQILIIEDQLVEAMNTSRLLKGFGMDVVGVVNELTQIEPILNASSPELILMDINLGGAESGIDVAKSIIKSTIYLLYLQRLILTKTRFQTHFLFRRMAI